MITLKSAFLTTGGNNFHYHQIVKVLEGNSSIKQPFSQFLCQKKKIKKTHKETKIKQTNKTKPTTTSVSETLFTEVESQMEGQYTDTVKIKYC